eukprot:tig00020816_g14188.t1
MRAEAAAETLPAAAAPRGRARPRKPKPPAEAEAPAPPAAPSPATGIVRRRFTLPKGAAAVVAAQPGARESPALGTPGAAAAGPEAPPGPEPGPGPEDEATSAATKALARSLQQWLHIFSHRSEAAREAALAFGAGADTFQIAARRLERYLLDGLHNRAGRPALAALESTVQNHLRQKPEDPHARVFLDPHRTRSELPHETVGGLASALAALRPGSAGAERRAVQLLFPYFCEAGAARPEGTQPARLSPPIAARSVALAARGAAVEAFRVLREAADLRQPHTWYPAARELRRRIIYHAGPTNSGKTRAALEALKRAESGVYCGPLRLLARQIHEQLNGDGVICDLLTGQERVEVPGATHIACTVEMVSTSTVYDVAVIDEIQMIGDTFRGYAWTRAFQGVVAHEVHVCGDGSAVELLRRLCAVQGDELEVVSYDRLAPLEPLGKPVESLRQIRPGDCVVAFSRRSIYEIKRQIEKQTKYRCCVVYGHLPPETRAQQARLFNEEDTGYDVLVASDAIGMGLNLHIKRVIFSTVLKFNGDDVVQVPDTQIKQIAGRAGRYASRYPTGFVTAMRDEDLDVVHAALQAPLPPLQAAGLFPTYEQLELFASRVPPSASFADILVEFASAARIDGPYFMTRVDDMQEVAKLLVPVRELSLRDRYTLCLAPVKVREPTAASNLVDYAKQIARGGPVALGYRAWELRKPRTDGEAHELEVIHSVVDMYLWLSQRMGDAVPFLDETEAHSARARSLELLAGYLAHGPRTRELGSGPGLGRGGWRSRAAARDRAGRGYEADWEDGEGPPVPAGGREARRATRRERREQRERALAQLQGGPAKERAGSGRRRRRR